MPLPAYFRLDDYNITPDDIVRGELLCEPNAIRRNVLITPIWAIETLVGPGDKLTELAPGRVFDLQNESGEYTVIRSNIGAPRTGDATLALGATPCRNLLFTGSVGGLVDSLRIGDVIHARASLSGDGFTRYLAPEIVPAETFERPYEPDSEFSRTVLETASELCRRDGVDLHEGSVYAIDTIVAQFSRIPHLRDDLGCIGIEMETAAVFAAANLVGIRAAALLQVSDVIPANKSLSSGRSDDDHERRRRVRRTTMREVLFAALARAES